MANEITLNGTLSYSDSEGTAMARQVASLLASVSSKKTTWAKQNIGITEEAVNLGETTAPGWAIFVNLDTVNFINLKVGTGGAIFAKLKPGEFALLRLGSGAQAPFAIADTAACQMEYLVCNT